MLAVMNRRSWLQLGGVGPGLLADRVRPRPKDRRVESLRASAAPRDRDGEGGQKQHLSHDGRQ